MSRLSVLWYAARHCSGALWRNRIADRPKEEPALPICGGESTAGFVQSWGVRREWTRGVSRSCASERSGSTTFPPDSPITDHLLGDLFPPVAVHGTDVMVEAAHAETLLRNALLQVSTWVSRVSRRDGIEDRVRRVLAHVRDQLHPQLQGHRCALGHLHHMLRHHRRRRLRHARVARRPGARESREIRFVDQMQLRWQWYVCLDLFRTASLMKIKNMEIDHSGAHDAMDLRYYLYIPTFVKSHRVWCIISDSVVAFNVFLTRSSV